MSTISDDDEVPPEYEAAVQAELAALRAEGKLARIEPRCKICRNEPVRNLVNKLLSMGLTRTSVLEALVTFNECLDERDKINYDNLRNHQLRHFNASQPAQAVWEAIVRKRAAESEQDLEYAVGAEVNAFSYLETLMVKGWQHLIDENTEVPYDAGVKAAIKLHEMTRKDAGAQQIAEIIAKQGRIISAIREVVPEQYHAAILARAEGNAAEPVMIEGTVENDDDDFDPSVDDDDDFAS